tara:strand:- start:190 stop:774 length:585 start_codon:yes stop_codon:yes gene_type:complete
MFSIAKPFSFYIQNYNKIYENDIIFSYNTIYHINKNDQIIGYIFLTYQLFNLFIFSILIPKYRTFGNFIHHISTAFSAFLCFIGYFHYFASYYAIYVEISTIFLTFNEIINITGYDMHIFKILNKILFVISFIFFRIIFWTLNTLFLLKITYILFKNDHINNIIIIINIANIILSIMQYYWFIKIIKKYLINLY